MAFCARIENFVGFDVKGSWIWVVEIFFWESCRYFLLVLSYIGFENNIDWIMISHGDQDRI